jgi:hypothetical protein
MKRMKVLFGQRRIMVLATLAILVLTAAALVASSASFTSRSTNPDNTFTAAGFNITNEHEGTAVFNVTNMKPDQSVPQSYWVRLDAGSADGNVTLTLDDIQDPIVPAGGAILSALLRVSVVDTTTSTTVVADQLLTAAVAHGAYAVAGNGGGVWVAGEVHDFDVTVTWPNGTAAVDNLRKGCRSTFDITWNGTSN